MIRLLLAILIVASASNATVCLADVPPPEKAPYAADRALKNTDALLLDWKDAVRNRSIPIKIYSPTGTKTPLPVILFSHGLGGTRETYEYLGRQWAAHGYVVIHLQHPGSDDSAWRGQERPMQSMVEAANLQNAIDRVKDVKFVLDQLEAVNNADGKLKGAMDLKSIGMAGHSFGAQTTVMIAGQKPGGGGPVVTRMLGDLSDARIKAAIPMSASVPAVRANLSAAFGSIRVPIFYMTGTLDDSPIGDTKAADRRLVYDSTKSASAAYLLTLAGGDHMTFSGRLQGAGRDNDQKFQRQIRIASTAFWDAYLKSDPAAKTWLNEGYQQFLGNDGSFERK